jgi:adenylate kinase
MRLVLLGPPGGGKGTQAVRLAAAFGVPHIATGDLFRAEMAHGTDLGKLAKTYISHGNLVPDQVVNDMVRARLARPDCDGYVLDGFPRTLEQASVLESMLSAMERSLCVAVKIEVPDDAIVERAVGREVCPNCNAVYHLTAQPPRTLGICDRCRGVLVVREDDQPSTVRHRLSVYHRLTEPVIEFYRSRGLLECVNGIGTLDEVFGRICDVSRGRCGTLAE